MLTKNILQGIMTQLSQTSIKPRVQRVIPNRAYIDLHIKNPPVLTFWEAFKETPEDTAYQVFIRCSENQSDSYQKWVFVLPFYPRKKKKKFKKITAKYYNLMGQGALLAFRSMMNDAENFLDDEHKRSVLLQESLDASFALISEKLSKLEQNNEDKTGNLEGEL